MFTKRWEKLGLNDEDDLCELQIRIMANPHGAASIQGTQGIRKLRFAPTRWHTGKRGATRVLYVYFEKYHIVLLCLIYDKTEIDNISIGVKQSLNKLILEIECELQRIYSEK